MNYEDIKNSIIRTKEKNNLKIYFNLLINDKSYNIYTKSVRIESNFCFFIAKEKSLKFFVVIFSKSDSEKINFTGNDTELNSDVISRSCPLSHENTKKLQAQFKFLQPKIIGLKNSFGFGDRLGIANAGHLRSLEDFDFMPVLAQQSIRELTRTQKKPSDVMDAAVFASLQEGWTNGFGADADHLKTTEDIDLMFGEGYTFFTFDPSEHVNNEADKMNNDNLNLILEKFNWDKFQINYEKLVGKYCNHQIEINKKELLLNVSQTELKKALVKYGNAILHLKMMFEYLHKQKEEKIIEVEVSIDETDSVTTAFEHFFISNEMHRLKIAYVSLAPRFVGNFEKGIDYKGDIKVFEDEFKKHISILRYFGDYKLSLHSGSDKFTIYKVIAKYDIPIHIKTAGTSYLEALRVAASVNPELFREILDFSHSIYKEEKKTYHVSAVVEKTKPGAKYSDKELPELLNDNNVRQILHVTYGRILTDKNISGKYMFRQKLYICLIENQDLYDEYLKKHFIKHLSPFRR